MRLLDQMFFGCFFSSAYRANGNEDLSAYIDRLDFSLRKMDADKNEKNHRNLICECKPEFYAGNILR